MTPSVKRGEKKVSSQGKNESRECMNPSLLCEKASSPCIQSLNGGRRSNEQQGHSQVDGTSSLYPLPRARGRRSHGVGGGREGRRKKEGRQLV